MFVASFFFNFCQFSVNTPTSKNNLFGIMSDNFHLFLIIQSHTVRIIYGPIGQQLFACTQLEKGGITVDWLVENINLEKTPNRMVFTTKKKDTTFI